MSIRLLTMCFLFRQCLERNPIVRLNINASRKHDYFSAVKWEAVAAKRLQGLIFSLETVIVFGNLKQLPISRTRRAPISALVLDTATI